MERKYSMALAHAAGRPTGQVRQMLRALREAGFVPGFDGKPSSIHVARVILALGADLVKDAAPTVATLRVLPLRTPAALPPTAEAMLAELVAVLPASPVLSDFDLDDGLLHLAADSVTLECLTLAGHRVCVRYGAPLTGIASRTTVPINQIRKIIQAIGSTK